MAETLTGSITEMPLLEIVKLLNSGNMTGRLLVLNNAVRGEIYVQSGQIYHCVLGHTVGQLALYSMLGWIEGRFSFESGIETAEKTVKASTEQLLLYGAKRIRDWQEIKKVVSSMDNIFAFSPDCSTESIELQPDEWKVIAYVNGNRTVSQIVELSDRDDYTVAKVLFRLFSIGLLYKVEQPQKETGKILAPEFFVFIEKELGKAIGPVADLIIMEQIAKLGETKETLSINRLPLLIEKLSDEISNDEKKQRFQQTMLLKLKDL